MFHIIAGGYVVEIMLMVGYVHPSVETAQGCMWIFAQVFPFEDKKVLRMFLHILMHMGHQLERSAQVGSIVCAVVFYAFVEVVPLKGPVSGSHAYVRILG